MMDIPVITIDGPTASGKGTISSRVAQKLGFDYLDSGAFYRAIAWRALQEKSEEEAFVTRLVDTTSFIFSDGKILWEQKDISALIRTEEVGEAASRIAKNASVRACLMRSFHGFVKQPGLVADGRDMGSVVFPSARLKIFLTASAEVRAERRARQLGLNKENVSDADKIEGILKNLKERDARDSGRENAPLVSAADAYTIDSSQLSIEEVVAKILAYWHKVA